MKNLFIYILLPAAIASQVCAFDFTGPKWPGTNPVVQYYINEQGCEQVPDEWEHLYRSFDVWQEVPTTAIKCDYMGTTNLKDIAADRKNVLSWAQGNEWTLSDNVIAACYYWYNGTTLIDFDIVFNGRNFDWSTTGEAGKMDIGHIATHEVGHALGIGHSSVEGAVMWPTAKTGDISNRTLSPDDSMAISFLYPRTTTNNHAPVITSTPVVEAIAGLKYEYQVTATDSDGDDIRYSLPTRPFNMRIDSLTGKIIWYPKFLDLGTHAVVVAASDNMGGTGKQQFTINVSDLVVFTNDTTINPGDTAYYNVMVTPMDGYGILAGNIEMRFNRSEFSILDVDTVGSILQDVTLATNIGSDTVRVAFAASQPFSGSGVLFRLKLTANADLCGRNTGFTILKAFFNDGDPVANTKNGSIFLPCSGEGMGSSVEGKVVYSSNRKGIGGVNVKCEEIQTATVTSQDGAYKLSPLPRTSLPYTVGISKDSGDVRNAVSAFDASLILRSIVGLVSLNSFEQQAKAADVNANDILSAYDAALILRYLVGIDDATKIGTWVCIPTSRSIPGLDSPVSEVDFEAYLIGDVSGNWGEAEPVLSKRSSSSTAVVLNRFAPAETIAENTDASFKTTVSVINPGAGIYSGEIEVEMGGINGEAVSVRSLALLNGFIHESYFADGKLRVAFAGTKPLIGEGDLFEISVVSGESEYITASSLESSAITFNRLNEATQYAVNISGERRAAPAVSKLAIRRIYPNPFIGEVHIEYSVPHNQLVNLSVYDMNGKKVAQLVNGVRKAGDYRVKWNGRDLSGRPLGAKIYFVRYTSARESKTVRLFKVR